MSTPIETNTEELNEILQTVYNLPNAGGGSSKPDLVIGLNVADTKVRTEDGSACKSITNMTVDDVSIVSGSVSAVVEKLKQGLPVRVVMTDIHFYWTDAWTKGITEAAQVVIYSNQEYPSEQYTHLDVVFFTTTFPHNYITRTNVQIQFEIDSGKAVNYWCFGG